MEINQTASAFANISPFAGQQAQVNQQQQRQQSSENGSATANAAAASSSDAAELRTDQSNPLEDQGQQTAAGAGAVNESSESDDTSSEGQRGAIVDVSV